MKTQYIVRGYIAFSDEDNFTQGCFGPSRTEHASGNEFTRSADSLDALIGELLTELRAERDAVLLDSCDENGRLDIQVQQRKPFQCARVPKQTNERFNAGEINLWSTCYSFLVERIETEFSLFDCVADKSIYQV